MKKLYLFLWGRRAILCCVEEKDVLRRQAWDFGDPAAPRIVEVPLQKSEVEAVVTGFESDNDELQRALKDVVGEIRRVANSEQLQSLEIFRRKTYTKFIGQDAE